MSKKDLTYFVRFGGLDLVNQKGFGKDTYHAPPARRGFYAMPLLAQEMFLVGSLSTTQPAQWPKSPISSDEKESPEEKNKQGEEFDSKKHYKRRVQIHRQIRKEFRKTTGYIWHHLFSDVDSHEVVARHNQWVKTSIKAWQDAFSRRSLNDRYGEDSFKVNSINEARGISGYYCKDHYEVFFDEKI